MKVTILHNAVAETDSASERDVLLQVAAVENALHSLGHQASRLPCTLNLETIEETLTSDRPDIVFNLVESLGRSDRLAHLAAVLLDDLDLPYTGNRAPELHLTNNKPQAKQRLRSANLPTPDWAVADCPGQRLKPPYIIKSVWEHASLGLDDHSVVTEGDGATVCDQIDSRSRQLGQPCFAEQFIDGREFNLSLIASTGGPRVLPPAEIDFSQFPPDRPKIVGYAAKWNEEAPEYHNTPRTFEFSPADAALIDRLKTMSLEIWQLFGVRGYARIDFRIDDSGHPWVLEINTNPCLSPDAGFAAALAQAEIPFEQAIDWIAADALAPAPSKTQCQILSSHDSPSPAPSMPISLPPPLPLTPSPAPNPRSPVTHPQLKLRTKPKRSDAAAVRALVAATGLFREPEINVAEELVQTRLKKGAQSGYEFIFAEENKEVVGYVCFGRNTLTVSSFDVYWIAVHPSQQGHGIGRRLLEEAENQIAAASGSRIYIETSHRPDYQPTRRFYERCGYELAAVLEDFYAPGDGKATYVKTIVAAPAVAEAPALSEAPAAAAAS